MIRRLLLLAGAFVLNVALALAAPSATITWVHPVAPPLTHLPELGEPVLGTLDAPPAPPPPPPQMGRGFPGNPGRPPGGPPLLRGLAGAVEVVVRATGTRPQREAVQRLHGLDQGVLPRAQRATALRVAIEDEAVAIAEAMGAERVGVILARREDLSTRYGEGRAWAAAIQRVSDGR